VALAIDTHHQKDADANYTSKSLRAPCQCIPFQVSAQLLCHGNKMNFNIPSILHPGAPNNGTPGSYCAATIYIVAPSENVSIVRALKIPVAVMLAVLFRTSVSSLTPKAAAEV
jgi:hypothetical protein